MRPRLATPRKWRRPSAARHSPKGEAGVERKLRLRGARGASSGLDEQGAKLHQRATAGVVLRSSGGRGRARRSYRLQKSTGGARPPSPMREERVDNEGRSSLFARERGGVKERRKPARPRQSGGYGGGLSTYRKWRARKRSPGSTCRWKSSRAEQVVRFDGRAMEAVLVFDGLGKPGLAGATGDVRGRSRSVTGEENPSVRRVPEHGCPDVTRLERGRDEQRVATG